LKIGPQVNKQVELGSWTLNKTHGAFSVLLDAAAESRPRRSKFSCCCRQDEVGASSVPTVGA